MQSDPDVGLRSHLYLPNRDECAVALVKRKRRHGEDHTVGQQRQRPKSVWAAKGEKAWGQSGGDKTDYTSEQNAGLGRHSYPESPPKHFQVDAIRFEAEQEIVDCRTGRYREVRQAEGDGRVVRAWPAT